MSVEQDGHLAIETQLYHRVGIRPGRDAPPEDDTEITNAGQFWTWRAVRTVDGMEGRSVVEEFHQRIGGSGVFTHDLTGVIYARWKAIGGSGW
jgi:hypothetical protein